ncbi:ABC transporter permease [Actinoallomurus iriomotensis]|uniref:Transporter n=1 Tax=Actinoallomurus iriomotensis TaxID=478107 RepID=A0A9W6VZW0_9ACTN|nr:ABC transporter permease [Actinoallomurus iriomotensis]GLY85749.1 transporter [Actinoallomurus iriomotensis]
MIWLTWRQFRTQAAVAFGAVVAILAALAATGPHLAHLQQTRGDRFLDGIGGLETNLYLGTVLALLVLPALIGMFWGAPLVTRELDAGTHRLAWTMTTRTRWLAAKLGLIGLAAMAASGLLGLAVTWWAGPIDKAIAARNGAPGPGFLLFPRLAPEVFDSRGIVPIGYAAFFFVLGVTIGILVRRTLPAMAILGVLFVAIQITMSMAVRPHLTAPERITTTISSHNLLNINMFNHVTVTIDEPGAWLASQQTVDAAGRPAAVPSWVVDCVGRSAQERQACFAKLAHLGYRQQVTYHPAGSFWSIQRNETALYLALAFLLAGFGAWWIRRLSR